MLIILIKFGVYLQIDLVDRSVRWQASSRSRLSIYIIPQRSERIDLQSLSIASVVADVQYIRSRIKIQMIIISN